MMPFCNLFMERLSYM